MAFISTVPLGVRRGVCAGHAALIAVLSLVPAWLFPPSATQLPGIDKVAHLAMYGVLGALLRWAVGGRPGWRAHLGWPLAAGAYGLLLEICQLNLGGGRGFSWGDFAANLAGVSLFWTIAGWGITKSK